MEWNRNRSLGLILDEEEEEENKSGGQVKHKDLRSKMHTGDSITVSAA
jgi:hypothetical protein